MTIPRFSTIRGHDEVVNRVQDRVQATLDGILRVPILDGVLIENIELIATDFRHVSHGLGRPWTGYLVVARDADSVVWDLGPTRDADTFIYLRSSAALKISVWVF